MQVELNQANFRRLVKLYLWLLLVSVFVLLLEYLVWGSFIEAFDKLGVEEFGEPTDLQLYGIGGLALACGVAHIVAAFGLLKFRSWSRSLFWIALLPMPLFAIIPGSAFGWSGPLSMWMDIIGSALLGAILLLAYSREHGSVWFKVPAKNAES